MKILLYVASAVMVIHGLIHLMGFVAYWPLGTIAELPYKTALAGGRWEVGAPGMKLYALFWLAATLGFLLGTAGLLAGQPWWRPVLLGTAVMSTAVVALDWAPAFRGAIVNAVLLVLMALAYLFPSWVSLR